MVSRRPLHRREGVGEEVVVGVQIPQAPIPVIIIGMVEEMAVEVIILWEMVPTMDGLMVQLPHCRHQRYRVRVSHHPHPKKAVAAMATTTVVGATV